MVGRFVERISAPLLTDVRITWRDLEVIGQLPEQAPDLFAGQPLLLRGRYRRPGTDVVEVEGFSQGATANLSKRGEPPGGGGRP